MRRVIYKYPLEVNACTIQLPTSDYEIVAVHKQNNTPTIWIDMVISDVKLPSYQPSELLVFVFPTGGDIPLNLVYQGTCFIGANVWHVYTAKP